MVTQTFQEAHANMHMHLLTRTQKIKVQHTRIPPEQYFCHAILGASQSKAPKILLQGCKHHFYLSACGLESTPDQGTPATAAKGLISVHIEYNTYNLNAKVESFSVQNN